PPPRAPPSSRLELPGGPPAPAGTADRALPLRRGGSPAVEPWNRRRSTMSRHRYAVIAALAGLVALPGAGSAQRPTQRQIDSLAAQVRALKAQLDSLRAALGRRPAAVAPPGGAAEDTSLAALRAAAAAAAGTDTLRIRADTAGPTKFVGRERSQPQLNPEISVTGDVRAYGQQPGVQHDNFDPREFEVGFQSPLDPYSSTKIFVSFENGDVSIEEGYAYWTGLPGH